MATSRFRLARREREPQWLATPGEGAKPARSLAALADLAAPTWREATRLASTPEDIADEKRPAAAARTWFGPRRSLLRWVAAQHLAVPPDDVVIAYDPRGAPRLVSRPACFVSVAARGSVALAAAAEFPIGVDIEPLDGDSSPAWSALSPSESAFLRGLDGPIARRAFLKIWTMKEAYLKAIGTGLNRDPSEITVAMRRARAPVLHDRGALVGASLCGWREASGFLAAYFITDL